MKILAIDPGVTQAGFALYQPDHPDREKGIECASFTSTGTTSEKKAEQFSNHLRWLINHHNPDFMVFELAIRQIFTYGRKDDLAGKRPDGPSSDQLILAELQGAIRQAAIDHILPFDSVGAKTWRAAIFGRGGGTMSRDQAKSHAKTMCQRLGIDANNHNEAEAAMIALWCCTCSQPFKMIYYKVGT